MIEKLQEDWLHLIPVEESTMHSPDGAWCWCAPIIDIASVSERLRTGALRVVRHVGYMRRTAMAPERSS